MKLLTRSVNEVIESFLDKEMDGNSTTGTNYVYF